ncbi:MAG TPA: hypothetical protein VJH22_06635 [Candidatus Nanoarchaeia archaeon]|nr:hypothetical protein [Candidatus Nanoarchaeia archaeon]
MAQHIETGVFSLVIRSVLGPDGKADHQIHAANEGVDPAVLIMHLKGFLQSEERDFFKRFDKDSNRESA